MAAPFSRLQLAAALIEYDNDPADPDAPHRSAHDSAIFRHLRRNPQRPQHRPRKSSNDYLGVSLPAEAGTQGGTESVAGTQARHSRGGSIDALRNPFGRDDTFTEEGGHFEDDDEAEAGGEKDDLEVDLTSWGLDVFLAKDKDKKNSSKGKGKAKTMPDAAPYPLMSVQSYQPETRDISDSPVQRRTTRSMSVGNYDHLSIDMDSHSIERERRKSYGSPLDLVGLESNEVPFERYTGEKPRQLSSPQPQALGVPFPSLSRSPSPMVDEDPCGRRRSQSIGSRLQELDMEGGTARRSRALSAGSMTSQFLDESNPFALRPPSRASKFDPKAAAHARTMSNASMGSRLLLDNDDNQSLADRMTVNTAFQQTQHPRYSKYDLMRPKVLVMPSPLQSVEAPPPPPEPKREGFEMSTDGPPLPPGARSTRRGSSFMGSNPTIAANSFTPNPRLNLTLSQLTFRNTLLVDGQRDVAYNDIDGELPRATHDGEQMFVVEDNAEEDLPMPLPNSSGPSRPPGKLYGKSLIDDLENRKAEMKSKQRVFTGDARPSMMSRGSSNRTGPLVDPTSLSKRPISQHVGEGSRPGVERRNSSTKPLLTFEDSPQPTKPGLPHNSRSVFGADTLWEREMAKLKEIEEQERLAAEQAEKDAAMAAAMKPSKKGKKGKESVAPAPPSAKNLSPVQMQPRVSMQAPTLPDIPRTTGKQARPQPTSDDEDEDSDSDDSNLPVPPSLRPRKSQQLSGWDSDDENNQNGPRRTTGVGPRFPNQTPEQKRLGTKDDSSDEDVPLAQAMTKAQRPRMLGDDDSDEEKPLSQLLSQSHSGRSFVDKDDDDQPLGLRAPSIRPDDDEQPLGLHPEQQRRTQYQMLQMVQFQQQQQQQMMMQQMHNSMFFNPSMLASGYFAPMAPNVMQAPVPVPSPPPIHDASKYARLEQWRYEVAGES